MQSILTTMAMPPFNMEVTPEDHRIYDELYNGYLHHHCSEMHSRLFANISFMLAKKSIVDHLLGYLETDVKRLWKEESSDCHSRLALHEPTDYLTLFGLRWPVPNQLLASNRSHYLLSRALLTLEQAHQLNRDDGSQSPIPTYAGYIADTLAEKVLQEHQLWNEDPKMAGLFFHGKMTHRIHFNLIMRAMDLKLLDTDQLSIHDLIILFTTVRTSYSITLAWNLLFDNVVTEYNVSQKPHGYDNPLTNALASRYPHTIEANHKQPYLYTSDPYFFHSYLMTEARAYAPHLSECVTQSYSKAARTIQRLEQEIKQNFYYGASPQLNHFRRQGKKVLPLQQEELDMKGVMTRQAKHFNEILWHAVSNEIVHADRANSGKTARVNKQKSYGSLEYRSIFRKPDDQSRQAGADAGVQKRCKI